MKGLSSVSKPKRKSQELKYLKRSNDCSLLDVIRSHWNLIISFLKVELGKNLWTWDSCREIGNVGKLISIWNSKVVETTIITTGSPRTVLLLDLVERAGPRRDWPSDDTCFLHGFEFLLGSLQLVRIQSPSFRKDWRTRLSEEMMTNSMSWRRGCEPVWGEDIRKIL